MTDLKSDQPIGNWSAWTAEALIDRIIVWDRWIEAGIAGDTAKTRANVEAVKKELLLRAKRPAGVQSFLDASTAHITKKDNEILTRWAEMEPEDSGQAAPYRTIAHAYGFFVHVRLDPARDRREAIRQARKFDISDAFLVLQAHARDLGCWWINLDRDADTVPGLKVHDWSKPE